MRKTAILALLVGSISLILGIISRLTMLSLPLAPTGIKATSFLLFTNNCFLAAIAFILLEIARTKK